MGESKTTLPWLEQYPGWFLAGALSPELFGAFRQVKPQMFNQVFGQGYDESQLAPYRRYTQQYTPFDYLGSNPFGRPGGPTQAEQDLLGNSYFGTTQPLNLTGPTGATWNLADFNRSLGPGGGYYPQQTADMFKSLGGQVPMPQTGDFPGYMKTIGGGLPGGLMGMPTVPTAPTIGAGPSAPSIPGAPGLPPFNFDATGVSLDAYNRLVAGQPGLADALKSSLHPQIALPAQSIFEQVAGQSGAGGPMDKYVQAATQGTTKAFENELAKQQLALNSRFAGEGVFGSGANLGALSNLTADATAQFAGIIGPMQLQAANQERERIYKAAETQYGTEYARNLAQVSIQAEQAAKMQATFAQLAASTGSSQAAAQASAYGAQANYLSNIYNTQVGGLTNIYGTQANIYGHQLNAAQQAYGTQANIYGTQMGALSSQQGQMLDAATKLYGINTGAASNQQRLVMEAAQNAAQLMSQNYGMSFDQAMKLALMDQQNKQAALDALRREYYQPGENLLKSMSPFFGLPAVTSSTGGGLDIGGLLAQAGKIAAAAAAGG